MSLQIGGVEGKYEILEKLGEGGMGTIYKVRHLLLDEFRVIKVIHAQHQGDDELEARFRHEAQAATRLRHPNIAQVHDLSIDEAGTAHIVMEYIEGMTLQALLSRETPPQPALAVEIAMQSLEAVGYLHQQGYIHRDISPDNIMLTRSFDGKALVKLIDLGLAKRSAGSLALTATGMFLGKVKYAAPEQFRDPDQKPDPRSDLYSFGVVLYELLTGTCPIQGSNFEQLISGHLMRPVPDFSETDPEGRIPTGLRELTLRALEKEPDRRTASAEEFLHLLAPYRQAVVPSYEEVSQEPDPSVSGSRWQETFRMSPAKPETRVDRGASGLGTLVEDQVQPAASVSSWPRRRPRWGLWAGAAGVAALLLLGLFAFRGGESPAAVQLPMIEPGSLRLNAAPWARVTSIVDAEGKSRPLDEVVFTPVVLSLEPGLYEVTLTHPALARPRQLMVEILTAQTTDRSVSLGAVDPDSYFEDVGLATRLKEAGL